MHVHTFLSSSCQFLRTFFGTSTRHVLKNDFGGFFDDVAKALDFALCERLSTPVETFDSEAFALAGCAEGLGSVAASISTSLARSTWIMVMA